MSRQGCTGAKQKWPKSIYIPLAPSETQNANNTVLSASKRETTDDQVADFPWGEGPEHSWQVRLRLVALRGHRWVLAGINTDCALGFPYPVVKANVQGAVKEVE